MVKLLGHLGGKLNRNLVTGRDLNTKYNLKVLATLLHTVIMGYLGI